MNITKDNRVERLDYNIINANPKKRPVDLAHQFCLFDPVNHTLIGKDGQPTSPRTSALYQKAGNAARLNEKLGFRFMVEACRNLYQVCNGEEIGKVITYQEYLELQDKWEAQNDH